MSLNHDHIPEPDQSRELFVAFANTLEQMRGEPVEHLPDIDALLAWLRQHDLLSPRGQAAELARLRRDPQEAERRMQRFRRLRDVLRSVAVELSQTGQISPPRLGELNHILRHGLHYHQLRHEPGGTRYAIAQVGDRLDQARAAIASSLAHFLADDDPHRLRVCANDACRYVFVDRSRTGRRRWCDMRTCGNQAKVARHRARARGASGSGVSPSAASV
ncbi:MAG TPA: CGNR zinc finger domain-containing protein [candidate division Zixibacteria bacterium]|nr:CGNR zinc finger domain-containing protein [candidate division Zixibacteria bacterium]